MPFSKLFPKRNSAKSSKTKPEHSTPVETPSCSVETPSSPVETPSSSVETPSSSVETPSSPVETPSSHVETPSSPVEITSSPVEIPPSPVETSSSPVKYDSAFQINELSPGNFASDIPKLEIHPEQAEIKDIINPTTIETVVESSGDSNENSESLTKSNQNIDDDSIPSLTINANNDNQIIDHKSSTPKTDEGSVLDLIDFGEEIVIKEPRPEGVKAPATYSDELLNLMDFDDPVSYSGKNGDVLEPVHADIMEHISDQHTDVVDSASVSKCDKPEDIDQGDLYELLNQDNFNDLLSFGKTSFNSNENRQKTTRSCSLQSNNLANREFMNFSEKTKRSNSLQDIISRPITLLLEHNDVSDSVSSSISSDEGFEDRIIQLKGSQLEKYIESVLEKTIRESVAEAVKSMQDQIISASENCSSDSHENENETEDGAISNNNPFDLNETFETSTKVNEIDEKSNLFKEIDETAATLARDLEVVTPDMSFDPKREDNSQDTHNSIQTHCFPSTEIHKQTLENMKEMINNNNPTKSEDIDTSVNEDNLQENSTYETYDIPDDETNNYTEILSSFEQNESSEIERQNTSFELSVELIKTDDEMDNIEASWSQDELSLKSVDSSLDFAKLSTEELASFSADVVENLDLPSPDDDKKVNWKVGYLSVKLPHKARGKGHLKVWKKKCVSIQPDEFGNDEKNPALVVGVYSGAGRKHSALFWHTFSKRGGAIVYRSASRTHPFAFTFAEKEGPVLHLAAGSETEAQEWMGAVRTILWPPSPPTEIEKLLGGGGQNFNISVVDNQFSMRAGLLGQHGRLWVGPRKLVMFGTSGHVAQEWYLNTIDKFQLLMHTRSEDVNKVVTMTTGSDSSTGRGDLVLFCTEAVPFLREVASAIHTALGNQNSLKEERERLAQWMAEEHYDLPSPQIKSLLDVPNFEFDKPLTPSTTNLNIARTSYDSGISTADDFQTGNAVSFVVGGGPLSGKSSDSEDE